MRAGSRTRLFATASACVCVGLVCGACRPPKYAGDAARADRSTHDPSLVGAWGLRFPNGGDYVAVTVYRADGTALAYAKSAEGQWRSQPGTWSTKDDTHLILDGHGLEAMDSSAHDVQYRVRDGELSLAGGSIELRLQSVDLDSVVSTGTTR